MSNTIQLETFKKEYENTLRLYQESIQNYISIISTNEYNNLTTVKGKTWWGKIGLSQGFSENVNTCKALCANNPQCSGATFNNNVKYCWTRSGDSELTPGAYYDYAIITKEKQAYLNMKGLNNRLIQLNEQIIRSMRSLNTETNSDLEKTNRSLFVSYNKLLEEKNRLDLLMNEYLSTDKTLENQTIFANQQSSLLKIWLIIACIIILLVLKELLGVSSLPIEISFWFIIIILLLLLSFMLKSANGFFILALIIIGILFTR